MVEKFVYLMDSFDHSKGLIRWLNGCHDYPTFYSNVILQVLS
jgi:hypothetical protein